MAVNGSIRCTLHCGSFGHIVDKKRFQAYWTIKVALNEGKQNKLSMTRYRRKTSFSVLSLRFHALSLKIPRNVLVAMIL